MSAEELEPADSASTASSDQPIPKKEQDEVDEDSDSLLPDQPLLESNSNKTKRKNSTDSDTEPLAKRIKSEASEDGNKDVIEEATAAVETKVEVSAPAGDEEDQDNSKAATNSQVRTLVINGEEYTYNERAAVREERDGVIEFRVVNDDNNRENMIILTGLKNIFQRQLPKMPREYIARLVYDRSHLSIAVVKKPLTVVGGITYRPFESRRFAEIVFCAIASSEQVKGYGAHLMNHLKDYVKATTPIMHFLTYADNYAIGYFRKQGFTKDITLDRSVWMGYIKDYEGGTIMQCTMLPRIRYLDSQKILVRQKAAILTKIREISKSHIVHKGIEKFKIKQESEGIDPMMIPGVREAGWTPEMDELARRPKRGPHYAVMQHLLSELQNHPSAWPFLQPVSKDDVTDYYEVIKEPMDLSTMEQRLDADAYQDIKDFIHDARLVYDNCRAYNNEHTTYFKNANKLEKFMKQRLKEIPEYADLANY